MNSSYRKWSVIRQSLVLAVAVVALALASGVAWSMGSRVPVVGTPVEDFELVDLSGTTQRLSQYRGKIVLLNFWATWCKPCTIEMPAMQASFNKLQDIGFVVLAINELEDEVKVRAHVTQNGHTFPVLMDRDNKVANQFGVFGLPVSVFVDPQGVIREYIKGGLLTEQMISDVVARIQKQEPVKAALLR